MCDKANWKRVSLLKPDQSLLIFMQISITISGLCSGFHCSEPPHHVHGYMKSKKTGVIFSHKFVIYAVSMIKKTFLKYFLSTRLSYPAGALAQAT